MDIIKNNKVVIAIVFIILVLVVIRSVDVNHFRNDTKRWAEPSLSQSNIITLEHVKLLTGKNLIINLDKNSSSPMEITGDVQNIPPDSVLSKKYISLIKNHNGPVLIFSIDPGLSARIWMILSQMGCQSVYIYTKPSDNESPKYKFRPDTIMH